MTVHRKNVMDCTRQGGPYQRHLPQAAVEMIEERHRDREHSVQGLGLHLMSETPPEIAEAVPLVVSAVQPDGEDSSGFKVLRKRLNRRFAIGRMVQNTDAVNDVEALRCEGQGEYIRLESNKVAVGEVLGRNLRRRTQVDADDARSPAGGDFCKPAHAASTSRTSLFSNSCFRRAVFVSN